MTYKNILYSLAVAILATTLSPSVLAKNIRLKPGLWQIHSQTALYGHVVPDVYSVISMGPERLKNHVDAMLLQNRVRLHDDGTATICLTAKQIARNHFVNDQGSGCSVSKGKRKFNSIHYDISCTSPSGSGTTDLSIISSTQWEATSRMTMTVRRITQTVDNKSYGIWLGQHCPDGQ